MDDQRSGAVAGDPADLVGRSIAARFRLERMLSASSASAIFVAVDEETGRSTTLRLFNAEATATYGSEFVCAARKGNVSGVQFHPEKSSTSGLRLLSNFIDSVRTGNEGGP